MSRLENYLISLRDLFPKQPGEAINMADADHAARAVIAHLIAEERVGAGTRAQKANRYLHLISDYYSVLDGYLDSDLRNRLKKIIDNASTTAQENIDAFLADIFRVQDGALVSEISGFHACAVQIEYEASDAFEAAYLTAFEGVELGTDKLVSQPAKEIDFDAGRIADLLKARFPEEHMLAVTKLDRVFGGFSKNTTICSLANTKNLPSKLVIRSDSGLALSGGSVVEEFPLLSVLYEAGIRVPRPLLVNADYGKAPLMIVEWTPGKSFGTPLSGAVYRSEKLCRELGWQLGKIHTLPLAALQSVKGYGVEIAAQVEKELAHLAEDWRALKFDDLVVEYALRWLADNIACSDELRGLVHGDYGPNNMLADGDELYAILDWESARVANPAEDLAYCRLTAETLWSWETFMESYVAAGAKPPSQQTMDYYSIYGMLILVVKVSQLKAACDANPGTSVRTLVPIVYFRRRSMLILQRYLKDAAQRSST